MFNKRASGFWPFFFGLVSFLLSYPLRRKEVRIHHPILNTHSHTGKLGLKLFNFFFLIPITAGTWDGYLLHLQQGI